MANKGLKSYTKQQVFSVGNIKGSANLYNSDANLHITLPILKTVGYSSIDLSLIYNQQNSSDLSEFGYGFKLNLYKNLVFDSSSKTVTITNSDGSVDIFTSDNYYRFDNSVLNQYVRRDYDFEDETLTSTYYYQTYDKVGNFTKHTEPHFKYPGVIAHKSGENKFLYFDDDSHITTINNNNNDTITFTKNSDGLVSTIVWKHSNVTLATATLSYTSSKLTSLVVRNKNNVIITNYTISYSTSASTITLRDNILGNIGQVVLSGNAVTSIKRGIGNTLKTTTNITYSGNKTSVTDELGNLKTYVFDNSGILRFEIDDKNNVISYSFDETLMKYTSSTPCHINDLSRDENLLKNISIADFIVSGTSLSKTTRSITDEFYLNRLGETANYFYGYGTLNKRVTGNFKSTDIITFVVWCRQATAYSESNKASVTLTVGEQSVTKYFDKTNTDSQYCPLVVGMVLEKSSSYVDLKIELTGYSAIMIAGISLIKKSFGAFYEYDSNGNVISKVKGRKESNFTYNSNNKVSETLSASSSRSKYKYDSKNNITEVLGAYQVKETNTYDSKNRATKTVTQNYDGSAIFEVSNTFTTDNNATNTDELLNDTNVITDEYGNILSVTNALNETLNYTYSNENRLIKILLSKNTDDKSIEYTYDANHHNKISTVTLSNGTVYSYTYDSYDRLITLSCNGELLVTYTYDNYDRVLSLKYGSNGDIVTFTYDSYSNITTLSLGDTTYSYEYNEYHQLISISANDVLKTYEYDLDGKISKVLFNNNYIKYSYDNLDNVTEVDVNIDDKRVITSHSSLSRTNGCNPEALLGAYDGKFMNCMFIDDNLVMTGPEVSVSPVITGDNTTTRSGIIPCYALTGANSIKYYLMDDLKTLGTFGLWIKPQYPQHSKDIITISSNDGSYVKVSTDSSYKLLVKFKNSSGETKTIISTNIQLLSSWTFIGLNWLCEDGVTRASLIVDGVISHYQAEFEMSLGSNPMFIPGHAIIGNIAAIMSSYKTIVSTEELMAYFRTTNDYIISKDNSTSALDYSNTTIHDVVDGVEIFPLQNNVKSLNGIEPVKFDQRVVSSYDRDRTFNYNYASNRYAYVADGGILEYDLNVQNDHTIGMNIYVDSVNGRQTIFEFRNSYYSIGLFINNNGKLYVDMNGYNQDTGFIIAKNTWTFVGLSICKTGMIESEPENYNVYTLKVFKDNQEYTTICEEIFELYGSEVIVGRKYAQTLTEHVFEPYYSTYPLLGQIEMMISKNSYCTLEEINNIRENISLTTISTGYNEFGLEINKAIETNNIGVMTKTNSYKNRSDDSGVTGDATYQSSYINKEQFVFNGSTLIREYELDEVGNVTAITNNNSLFDNHDYEYDYRGYLVKDNDEDYQYDDNGNITLCGTNQYEYTDVNKDKLTKACGHSIVYDENYGLNPESWNGRDYSWVGRRLISYEHNNIMASYVYNEQGLRSSKTVDGVTTNYFYDGKKLIAEINPSYRLDFLYDEYNMLFGFVYNDDKYFYVRDQLLNIIGIIDKTGNLIVQYNYNAYGNNMIISGNTTIGNINPFRYKGYYYDNESGMYYCNSRYYNPLWCRWLNADSINYLDVTDISCTNLYQYCGNNPVLGYDPNGNINWWKLGALALAAVSIVAGVAATVCTFGAGSVAGVLAITTAITIAANATEVAILQSKKSDKDGDSFEEKVDDCINAVFDNTIGKISNMSKTKPLTQFAGIAGGMVWESLGSNPIEMLKYTLVRTFDTYKNYGVYITGPASKAGAAFSYGYAAINVGFTIGSCFVPDEYIEEYADFRGYILY